MASWTPYGSPETTFSASATVAATVDGKIFFELKGSATKQINVKKICVAIADTAAATTFTFRRHSSGLLDTATASVVAEAAAAGDTTAVYPGETANSPEDGILPGTVFLALTTTANGQTGATVFQDDGANAFTVLSKPVGSDVGVASSSVNYSTGVIALTVNGTTASIGAVAGALSYQKYTMLATAVTPQPIRSGTATATAKAKTSSDEAGAGTTLFSLRAYPGLESCIDFGDRGEQDLILSGTSQILSVTANVAAAADITVYFTEV